MPPKPYPALDLTIVCGRRPGLLARTLESFKAGLFDNFQIAGVYFNIDPFAGDDADHADCRRIALDYFPAAEIIEPAVPSYGQAVKSLWSRIKAPVAFHLEDDWLLKESLRPERVFPIFDGSVRAAKLVSKEINWNRKSVFDRRHRRTRYFNMKIPFTTYSVFGVSPGFVSGDFANECSRLMNPDLDPEKQMRPPFNPPLYRYTARYDCVFLPGEGVPEIIEDIGRGWRSEQRIDKIVVDGKSVWTHA